MNGMAVAEESETLFFDGRTHTFDMLESVCNFVRMSYTLQKYMYMEVSSSWNHKGFL